MSAVREVHLDAVVRDTDPTAVFDRVARFERFPSLAPHVRSNTVHSGPPEDPATGPREVTGGSSWELHFRSGLLRWTERDRFDRAGRHIEFTQEDGDFDTFSGSWAITADGPDSTVAFRAAFDFGIPSLEGILDPIAERVIKETVAWVLVGMFARVDLLSGVDLIAGTVTHSTG